MKINKVKVLLFLGIAALVVTFYLSGMQQNLTLEKIQQNLELIRSYNERSPVLMQLSYLGLYVLITSLSIPGAIVLTLLAGAIFGVVYGTLMVSLASTMGATIAFLMSRYLFREGAMYRFGSQFNKINRKFHESGNSYLFTMRLIPVSPYVVINVLMGLTSIKTWSYIWITFLGMLPGNLIYVYAGRKIAEIESAREILTWPIILTLTSLGFLPFILKWIVNVTALKVRSS